MQLVVLVFFSLGPLLIVGYCTYLLQDSRYTGMLVKPDCAEAASPALVTDFLIRMSFRSDFLFQFESFC